MIAQRRIRVITRILTLTRGKTVGIATRSSAVVVPTRSPVAIVIRRSTTVTTAVATTWRGGSGSKGEISRQVDGLANVRVHLPVGKQAHVAADMLIHLRKSTRIGLWTPSATRGITDVDHARCWCGNRDGWCGHVLGSHTFSRSVGNGVVGRDDSRCDCKAVVAVFIIAVVEEDVVVVVGRWWQQHWATADTSPPLNVMAVALSHRRRRRRYCSR